MLASEATAFPFYETRCESQTVSGEGHTASHSEPWPLEPALVAETSPGLLKGF